MQLQCSIHTFSQIYYRNPKVFFICIHLRQNVIGSQRSFGGSARLISSLGGSLGDSVIKRLAFRAEPLVTMSNCLGNLDVRCV